VQGSCDGTMCSSMQWRLADALGSDMVIVFRMDGYVTSEH
jgi:hypothetical protein